MGHPSTVETKGIHEFVSCCHDMTNNFENTFHSFNVCFSFTHSFIKWTSNPIMQCHGVGTDKPSFAGLWNPNHTISRHLDASLWLHYRKSGLYILVIHENIVTKGAICSDLFWYYRMIKVVSVMFYRGPNFSFFHMLQPQFYFFHSTMRSIKWKGSKDSDKWAQINIFFISCLSIICWLRDVWSCSNLSTEPD